jgi:formamidopyrimidine-DNA glycosylase
MFQLELYAYGRKGEECKRCGAPIEKIVVGGRGTHFCPNCQQSLNR